MGLLLSDQCLDSQETLWMERKVNSRIVFLEEKVMKEDCFCVQDIKTTKETADMGFKFTSLSRFHHKIPLNFSE